MMFLIKKFSEDIFFFSVNDIYCYHSRYNYNWQFIFTHTHLLNP